MPQTPERNIQDEEQQIEETISRGNPNLPNDHWEVDPEEVFNEIIKLLQGYELNSETGKYEIETNNPLMNHEGKLVLKAFLTSAGNKITYITKFDEDEVADFLVKNHKVLIDHLIDNYEEYGIKLENIPLIARAIMNPVKAGAKRAEKGTMMKYNKDIEQRTQTVHTSHNNQNKSKWDKINFWS